MIFESTIQKTNLWLKDVQAVLRTDDRAKAYGALRGVLHVLRDCMPIEECVKFSAQLPLLLTGVFFDGWKARRKPMRLTKAGFFHELRERVPGGIDVGLAARAAFHAIERHVSAGEIQAVLRVLPHDVRAAWIELAEEARSAPTDGAVDEASSLERDFEPIDTTPPWQPGWAARQLGERSGGVTDLGPQEP